MDDVHDNYIMYNEPLYLKGHCNNVQCTRFVWSHTILGIKGTCTSGYFFQIILSTVLVIIKLTKNPVSFRFRCGFGKLKFCSYFIMFSIFKNVVHSLKPGETPSYSASHQAPNYVQRS